MALDTNSNQPSVHDFFVNPIQSQNVVKYLAGDDSADSLASDINLYKYLNESAISEMINVNSEIVRILGKFKIPIKINMGILHNLVGNHLPQTRRIALGIANHLPQHFKAAVNRKALREATSLHDIAKVIMPENIINKAGSLTEYEKKIMQKHAELSYEMLKTTDLDKETLELIKNHHHTHSNKNHPTANDGVTVDINLQILSMSDIYSALREKRSYKTAMTPEQALEIIKKEMDEGRFHPYVYQALVEYASKDEKLNNSNSKRKLFNFKPVDSFSS